MRSGDYVEPFKPDLTLKNEEQRHFAFLSSSTKIRLLAVSLSALAYTQTPISLQHYAPASKAQTTTIVSRSATLFPSTQFTMAPYSRRNNPLRPTGVDRLPHGYVMLAYARSAGLLTVEPSKAGLFNNKNAYRITYRNGSPLKLKRSDGVITYIPAEKWRLIQQEPTDYLRFGDSFLNHTFWVIDTIRCELFLWNDPQKKGYGQPPPRSQPSHAQRADRPAHGSNPSRSWRKRGSFTFRFGIGNR